MRVAREVDPTNEFSRALEARAVSKGGRPRLSCIALDGRGHSRFWGACMETGQGGGIASVLLGGSGHHRRSFVDGNDGLIPPEAFRIGSSIATHSVASRAGIRVRHSPPQGPGFRLHRNISMVRCSRKLSERTKRSSGENPVIPRTHRWFSKIVEKGGGVSM